MTFLARLFPHLYKWLPLVEGVLAFAAVYAAIGLRIGLDPSLVEHHLGPAWPEALTFAAIVVLSLSLFGLYNSRLRVGFMGVLARIAMAFATATIMLAVFYYAVAGVFLGRGILALSLLFAFTGVVVLRAQINRAWYAVGWQRRVLVLGAGQRAARLAGLRRRTDLIGLQIVGFIPFPGDDIAVESNRLIHLEDPLADWVSDHGVVEVVIAPDERRGNIDTLALLACRRRGVAVCDLEAFYERETGQVSREAGASTWLAYSNTLPGAILSDQVKRGIDMIVSILLSLLTAPIVGIAALAIWIESGFRGPVLYRQVRVGRYGKPFEMLKLRSMVMDAEADGAARWASQNDPRITRAGRIMRRYRIDELPQLYNVLRGEMSFVGPRPERPEFARRLEEQLPSYAERHRVKPGLTGWAQIRYPYGASEEQAFDKLQYDLYYVKNHSMYLDLVILLQTAEVVLFGKGAR